MQGQHELRADLAALKIERTAAPAARAPRGRRWLAGGLALAVAAALGVALMRLALGRPVPVRVAAVAQHAPGTRTTAPVLSGSGYVVTGERYVSLGVRVPGRIERYFVEEGQSVTKGDPLVQLDDRDYRATVARAEAALGVARANSDLADAELARGRRLRGDRVISEQELDVLQNKAAVAHATVAQLEAELAQARVNLDYTLLRSPTDGIVLAKLKEVGEIAVPGGFAGSGDLIRLANLADVRAEVDVNEADLSRVHMGQPAHVVPDAYPNLTYEASVVKMYPQVDRQKGTLKVEVRVLRPDGKLLPDMSVRVTFLAHLTLDKPGTVSIPAAALRRGPSGTFVWAVRGGKARRQPVEIANELGDPVYVTGGLGAGEQVIVSDDRALDEGREIEIARP